MKSATKTMYTIGRIFTLFEVVGSAIMAILGIVAMAASEEVYREAVADGYTKFENPAAVKAFGIAMLVCALITLIVQIVVLVLAKNARKAVEENEKDTKPHIVMIVIGVFSNIFYILGGAFGIASADKK